MLAVRGGDGLDRTMIQIRLLGAFHALREDGTRIEPPGRRSLALLALLALDNRGWRRSELAAWLWHDRTPEQARASMRQELLRLRKAFGPILADQPGDPRAVPQLVSDLVSVDAVLFRSAATERGRTLHAVALYRGDLLQDAAVPNRGPFPAWLKERQDEMRATAVRCLCHLLQSGEGSVAVARRLVELQPGCAEAYAWLMRHHAEHGEIAEALASCNAYATALRTAGRDVNADLQDFLAGLRSRHERALEAHQSTLADWLHHVRSREEDASERPITRRLAPVTDRPSIVVLPYADISREAFSIPLADGLTEEVTNALALIPGLFVTARHSAAVYGQAGDVRRIAADLGVRYVVEGSLELDRRRIRVNTRLIEGSNGFHIWAGSLERNVDDLLTARDEIVRAVAGQLHPSILGTEIKLAFHRSTERLDAWGWLLRAQGLLLRAGRERGMASAIEPLRRALELDPDYAMAHSLLGAVHTWRTLSYAAPDWREERALARRHSEIALRLAPDNPFVLVNCAEIAIYSAGDIDLALTLLERAVERNPNDPHGLALLGNARRFAGEDARTSLALIGQALRVSPADGRSFSWLHYASWCHWKLEDLQSMEKASRRSIELRSNYPHSWIALTCALGLQGRTAEARHAGSVLRELHPRFQASNFYDVARHFYGRRFQGEVDGAYQRLCSILTEAT